MPSIPQFEPAPNPAPPWRRLLRARHLGSFGWAIGLAVAVAVLLNPIFLTPFPTVLGRTLFVALVLVLVFHTAGLWHSKAVPRWLVQTLAVGAAAPLATLGVYLVSTGGDLSAIVQNPYRVAGFGFIAGSALVIGLVVTLVALVRERDAQARAAALEFEVERGRLERQALDARLALLTAQVEPHFLFNTLANVQALVETGSPRAPAVLRSLIAYLRAALPRLQTGGTVTLGDEAALVRAYLDLMHMRMPDRLQYEVQIEDSLLGLRFPPMALLTLVENAVRHGIDPSEEGGRIVVGARRDGNNGELRLWVSDSGVGLAADLRGGTGLTNLRSRLQGAFGAGARLELTANTPHGTRAEIVLPQGFASQ